MQYGIGEVSELLGVSPDSVRRWVDAGKIAATRNQAGHRQIDGASLAEFVVSMRDEGHEWRSRQSARNRFPGIVTAVVSDQVSAKVEIQAGPHRIVSLHTAEAVAELGLEPGMRATAIVKATNVILEG